MNTKDIHIRIEQGLNNVGSFAYDDIDPDETDIAYNTVVYQEIRNVFRDIDGKVHSNNFERNQYYTDYLRILKKEFNSNGTDNGDNQSITLPNDYVHRINDYSVVIAKNCKGKQLDSEKISDCEDCKDKIEKDFYYKAIGDVKYNQIWYKNCDIFKGIENITDFYGKVNKIPIKKVQNRLTRSEVLNWNLHSQIAKSVINSPISELIGNELRVFKEGFDVAEIGLTYIRKPLQISYYDRPNEINEFTDNIILHFVEKTIQKLAVNTEQSQQKIYNKKTENIENN